MSNKATCMYCGKEVKVFKNGEMARHKPSADALQYTYSAINNFSGDLRCAGSGLLAFSPDSIAKEIERLQNDATIATPLFSELDLETRESVKAARKAAIAHLQSKITPEVNEADIAAEITSIKQTIESAEKSDLQKIIALQSRLIALYDQLLEIKN